jgi:type I restriction enzyme M protein
MEQEARYFIDHHLTNKGWVLDKNSPKRNVYVEGAKTPAQKKALCGGRPDYVLYKKDTDIPLAVIEAKKTGVNLQPALDRAVEYATCLNAPLVFAMNGTYAETKYVPNGRELILNGYEVRELLREVEALAFIQEQSNEAYTIPKEIVLSRKELIGIFNELNNTLRAEGLRAGIERFSEFANILFLKLISENNEKPWWNSICNQDDSDIIGYINGYVIKNIERNYGGNVFTPASIKNPLTLRRIIDRLKPLTLSTINTDIKGDAFEYFLRQTTSTQNDLGEYFTPRHIIKTIVNLAAPKFGEKIYDPFCGTGGFLIEAYSYIKGNTLIKTEKQRKKLRENTIFGREITNSARIAKMNMILHGDGHSGIEQIDSLASPVDGTYDVVMTNIPFSQRTQHGSLYYDGIAKNNGDAVCILHSLRCLKPGGRMAMVVPEGFLFRKDMKMVREFLLSKAKLQSVISLPQGVFLPYTGVKTNIIYFTDVHKPQTQKTYWYFEVKKDGYSLDHQRKSQKGQNDLHKIEGSDIKRAEQDESYKENVLAVGFEVISLNEVRKNDFNLVGSVYKKFKKKGDRGWPLVELGDVIEFSRGFSYRSEMLAEEGTPLYNLKSIKKDMRSQFDFKFIDNTIIPDVDNRYFCKDGDLLMAITDLTPTSEIIARTIIAKESGLFSMDLAKLVVNNEKISSLYLHYICNNDEFLEEAKKFSTGNNVKHLSLSNIKTVLIPLPPFSIQEKIVAKIEEQKKKQQELQIRAKQLQEKIQNDITEIWQQKAQY